ncbi:MAG TPA: M56 family metallopeptidase, partial [Hanamia sp.]
MPALFVFLLKVNIALIVYCLGYYLVLRHLTFYTLNRVYLGIAIIFSTVYPLINLDNFVQKHNIPIQKIIVDWKIPAKNFVSPLVQQATYWHWATLLFWTGAVLFAARLFMQLLSLYKLYKNSEPGNLQDHEVRIVKANISPFSFWQSIYINPDNLNPDDLKSVLKHEQVHVQQWHTLDILLTEISVIFYWFNPGVWLMKKAVRENIEFITDRKILQKGMDSKAYQYSLLNVSFSATTAAGITNNFNFSTLKKRITMMNAKRSSNVNLTRYAFLVPAVLICLFAISLSKAELV